MTDDNVTSSDGEGAKSSYLVFKPYPLQVGHRIFIESGPRRGDWKVIGLSDRKIRLRCPFSGREVEWDRFCYLVEEKHGPWPHPE
ncbi:MAG: hypothetical protein WBN83_09330 [Desulfoprunum sp.]|jgi:hypothetical protein|uniref:hypothetical protein n=1 Tax=Desulfoprunum sp. TaxID=2020866 RepID=UPI00068F2724